MKALRFLGWIFLSIASATGLASFASGFSENELFSILFALVGFVFAWSFRSVLTINEWGIFGLFVAAVTIGGVSLFLIHIVAPEDQRFWYGFTLAGSLLGSCILFQMRNVKSLQEKLLHEIYYSDFEWYRNQRHDKEQLAYDRSLKK